MLAKVLKNSSSQAKIVDGKLVLSFPQAVRPVLWHMNIAETQSCAFEIRESEAPGGKYSLILKKDKEAPLEIAAFPGLEEATGALMAVSSALEKSRGLSQGFAVGGEAHQVQSSGTGSFLRFAGAVAGIILLLVLVNALWSLAPRPPQSIASANLSDLGATNQQKAKETIGAPVSADDFLSGR